jgi:3-isopropylmalate/(R)-2-methylmalate dehydratase small subunit
MQPVSRIAGRAYPLARDNVDTDVILPGRFLKTITRSGLGVAAFESIRAEPGNLFDDPRYHGAPILIAGENFGCGSSREHAVWAMMDLGIGAVIAESYSDIFSGNAFKNGLLTIVLPPDLVAQILEVARAGASIEIDLATQTIALPGEVFIPFDMDPFRKDCLLRGLDEIGLTLGYVDKIAAFELQHDRAFPWLSLPVPTV